MAINSFKQTLHFAVAKTDYYDVVGKGEVGPEHLGNLEGLAKNPVDYVIEEGRGESTSLSNAGADIKSLVM